MKTVILQVKIVDENLDVQYLLDVIRSNISRYTNHITIELGPRLVCACHGKPCMGRIDDIVMVRVVVWGQEDRFVPAKIRWNNDCGYACFEAIRLETPQYIYNMGKNEIRHATPAEIEAMGGVEIMAKDILKEELGEGHDYD